MRTPLFRLMLMLLCLAGSLALIRSGNTAPERRTALVFGNASYVGFNQLPNCRNDARQMTAALQRLGFTVTPVVDGSLLQMREALETFHKQLGPSTVAMVYYSGHGVQTDGQNYLIPVDARIRSKAQLKSLGLPLQEVLDELEGAKASVVILDACRDDELPAEAKGGKKGLVVVTRRSGPSSRLPRHRDRPRMPMRKAR